MSRYFRNNKAEKLKELKDEVYVIEKKELKNMANISPEKIVQIAELEGEIFNLAEIKTNQIRNVYSQITAMKLILQQNKNAEGKADYAALRHQLILLKPKLAYAAGRQAKIRDFVYNFMKDSIDGVINAKPTKKLLDIYKDETLAQEKATEQAYQNFFDLIESVVAYHKFYGDN